MTLTRTADANEVYNELLKTKAFVVPENNPDRLKHWPELESKEMEVTFIRKNESAADVILSSAGKIQFCNKRKALYSRLDFQFRVIAIVVGWLAISGKENERVLLRAWSPQGRGLYLRTPALLRKSVVLRGARVRDVPTYRSGRQAYRS